MKNEESWQEYAGRGNSCYSVGVIRHRRFSSSTASTLITSLFKLDYLIKKLRLFFSICTLMVLNSDKNMEITVYVSFNRFPKYMPPGLFEMLSVRAHRGKHQLRFLNHWGGGFHARHKLENVQV